MKKDIEWLKQWIEEYESEVIKVIERRKYEPDGFITTLSRGKQSAITRIKKKIDRLDEPEVLSQEWIDDKTFVVTDSDGDDYAVVGHASLQNLIIPKQEITEEQVINWLDKNDFYDHITAETVLERAVDEGELSYYGTKYSVIKTPTIPKYVAEWIEEANDRKLTLYGAICDCPREVDYWLIDGDCSNQGTFARAWLDGYTVEREPLYYALVKGHELVTDAGDLTSKYWNFNTSNGDVFPSNRLSEDGKFLIEMSKSEWNELGINDSNADFVKVEEIEE
jgi:hypothetical protein